MNKEMYIIELRNKLAGFDEELVEEIVLDYQEHFSLGYAQGKSDEEIIASLGSIDDLVKEIESSYQRNNKTNNNMSFTIDFSSLNDLSDRINEATEKLSKDLSEKYNNKYEEKFAKFASNAEKWGKAAEKFSREFTEEFERQFNKINESFEEGFNSFYDEYYNASNSDSASEESSFDLGQGLDAVDKLESNLEQGIQKIIVRNFLGRIEVRHTNAQPSINYHNYGSIKQKLMYSFRSVCEGDTMILSLERNNLADYTRHNCFNCDCDLEIELSHIDEIRFENCTSSDIFIDDVSINTLQCNLLSGDVEINNVTAKSVSITSNSGDLEINDSLIGVLDVKTTDGSIYGDNNMIDTTRIKSVSGDVEFNDGQLRRAGIVTTSGDIEIYSEGVMKIGCESISGDIITTAAESSEVHAKTTSGDIQIGLHNNNRGFSAKLKTTSGDISVHYGDIDLDELQKGNYTFNEQDARIVAYTLSGDIEITD